jgi:hypothetical protein
MVGDGILKLRGERTLFYVICIEWALILVSIAELSTGEGGCLLKALPTSFTTDCLNPLEGT